MAIESWYRTGQAQAAAQDLAWFVVVMLAIVAAAIWFDE
jgi:hypothetical protein